MLKVGGACDPYSISSINENNDVENDTANCLIE